MTYFSKNNELQQGYNAYIDAAADDMGTQMDVGLLVMEAGDTFTFEEAEVVHGARERSPSAPAVCEEGYHDLCAGL